MNEKKNKKIWFQEKGGKKYREMRIESVASELVNHRLQLRGDLNIKKDLWKTRWKEENNGKNVHSMTKCLMNTAKIENWKKEANFDNKEPQINQLNKDGHMAAKIACGWAGAERQR